MNLQNSENSLSSSLRESKICTVLHCGNAKWKLVSFLHQRAPSRSPVISLLRPWSHWSDRRATLPLEAVWASFWVAWNTERFQDLRSRLHFVSVFTARTELCRVLGQGYPILLVRWQFVRKKSCHIGLLERRDALKCGSNTEENSHTFKHSLNGFNSKWKWSFHHAESSHSNVKNLASITRPRIASPPNLLQSQ